MKTCRTRTSLSEMHPGQEARVVEIKTNDPSQLRKLIAMGLLPGTIVTLVRRAPVCVFRVGESEFACDESISRAVLVAGVEARPPE